MINAIIRHELRHTLANSRTWYSMAILFALMAIIFNFLMNTYLQDQIQLTQAGVTEAVLHPFYAWFSLIGLVLTPSITTQFMCAEKTRKTMINYYCSNITSKQLFIGKLLSLIILLTALMLAVSVIPLTVVISGKLDWGHFATSFLGVNLMLSVAVAVGLCISTFMQNIMRSNFIVFVGLVAYVLLEWAAQFTGSYAITLQRFALLRPLKSFLAGMISPSYLIYYLTVIAACVFISSWRLEFGRYHD